jgi:hypothetical protein
VPWGEKAICWFPRPPCTTAQKCGRKLHLQACGAGCGSGVSPRGVYLQLDPVGTAQMGAWGTPRHCLCSPSPPHLSVPSLSRVSPGDSNPRADVLQVFNARCRVRLPSTGSLDKEIVRGSPGSPEPQTACDNFGCRMSRRCFRLLHRGPCSH